jgi:hypothetical protein
MNANLEMSVKVSNGKLLFQVYRIFFFINFFQKEDRSIFQNSFIKVCTKFSKENLPKI